MARCCLVLILAVLPLVLFSSFYPRLSVAGWSILDFILPEGTFLKLVIAYSLLLIPILFWLWALYVDKYRLLKVANSKDYWNTNAHHLISTLDTQAYQIKNRLQTTIRERGFLSATDYWKLVDLQRAKQPIEDLSCWYRITE